MNEWIPPPGDTSGLMNEGRRLVRIDVAVDANLESLGWSHEMSWVFTYFLSLASVPPDLCFRKSP